MRPYVSRDGAIPAAGVPLSPSQSRSLEHACEPEALRGIQGATPIRTKAKKRLRPAADGNGSPRLKRRN